MASHLMLGALAPNWRLHVSESPEGVTERLRAADAPVPVRVVVADQLEPTTLWVNTAALAWWAVAELPDPDA